MENVLWPNNDDSKNVLGPNNDDSKNVLGPNNDDSKNVLGPNMMIPKMYQDQIMMIENVLGLNIGDRKCTRAK